MNTETITLSANNQASIIYKLTLKGSEKKVNCEKIMNDFFAIIEINIERNDWLSLKIKNWAEKVLIISPEVDINNPESLLNKLEYDIHELFHKVLVCPYFIPLTRLYDFSLSCR